MHTQNTYIFVLTLKYVKWDIFVMYGWFIYEFLMSEIKVWKVTLIRIFPALVVERKNCRQLRQVSFRPICQLWRPLSDSRGSFIVCEKNAFYALLLMNYLISFGQKNNFYYRHFIVFKILLSLWNSSLINMKESKSFVIL
jgi:hypothetical protein